MEAVLAGLLTALALIAFASGRGWVLILPFVAVPAFYVGLHQGWWGDGLGDRWHLVAFGLLALAVGVTAAGVFVRRLVTSD